MIVSGTRAAQYPIRVRKPPGKNEFRKGKTFGLEKLVDVSRGHTLTFCDRCNRQIIVAKVCGNIGHNCPKPCSPDAMRFDGCREFRRSAYRGSYKVVDVGYYKALELRCLNRLLIDNCTRISNEQTQCLGTSWNDSERGIVKPAENRCNGAARHTKTHKAYWRRTVDREAARPARGQHCIASIYSQVVVALLRRAAATNINP